MTAVQEKAMKVDIETPEGGSTIREQYPITGKANLQAENKEPDTHDYAIAFERIVDTALGWADPVIKRFDKIFKNLARLDRETTSKTIITMMSMQHEISELRKVKRHMVLESCDARQTLEDDLRWLIKSGSRYKAWSPDQVQKLLDKLSDLKSENVQLSNQANRALDHKRQLYLKVSELENKLTCMGKEKDALEKHEVTAIRAPISPVVKSNTGSWNVYTRAEVKTDLDNDVKGACATEDDDSRYERERKLELEVMMNNFYKNGKKSEEAAEAAEAEGLEFQQSLQMSDRGAFKSRNVWPGGEFPYDPHASKSSDHPVTTRIPDEVCQKSGYRDDWDISPSNAHHEVACKYAPPKHDEYGVAWSTSFLEHDKHELDTECSEKSKSTRDTTAAILELLKSQGEKQEQASKQQIKEMQTHTMLLIELLNTARYKHDSSYVASVNSDTLKYVGQAKGGYILHKDVRSAGVTYDETLTAPDVSRDWISRD